MSVNLSAMYVEPAKARVEAAAAKMAEASAYRLESQWAFVGEYLEAVAYRDLWVAVWVAVEWVTENSAESPADALKFVMDDTEKALLSNRWTARSTDLVSNAADLTMARVASRWLQHDARAALAALAAAGEE